MKITVNEQYLLRHRTYINSLPKVALSVDSDVKLTTYCIKLSFRRLLSVTAVITSCQSLDLNSDHCHFALLHCKCETVNEMTINNNNL